MLKPASRTRSSLTLSALILVQSVCALFFLGDVMADLRDTGAGFHLSVELFAALSLIAGVVFEVRYLMELLRRTAHLERNVAVARAAVQEVIEAHFDTWALSPAERDVAGFLVKGLSIAEIAALRESAEGTVKAHLNAIYRKSGTRSRSDLMAVLIDSLMAGPERQA